MLAGFDILVGFEILAIIYAAHAIMWQLLERYIGKHCWLACLEHNEKNDVQKSNNHVKSKSEVGKESVKKIKAHWTQRILMEQSSMSTAISR